MATGKLKIYRTETGFVTITEIEGTQMEVEWNLNNVWTNKNTDGALQTD